MFPLVSVVLFRLFVLLDVSVSVSVSVSVVLSSRVHIPFVLFVYAVLFLVHLVVHKTDFF